MERDLPVGMTGIGLQSLRRACSSVCLSAQPRISETTRQNFTKFSMHVTVAVARSFSGGVAICYVLPVLWMASYLPKSLSGKTTQVGRISK